MAKLETKMLFDAGSEDKGREKGKKENNGGKRCCGGKRFVDVPNRRQMSLEVRCIDDFVPEDALVRIIKGIVDMLDVEPIEDEYCGGGRPAYPPRLLVRVFIYAYCMGVRSAREIARRLESDVNSSGGVKVHGAGRNEDKCECASRGLERGGVRGCDQGGGSIRGTGSKGGGRDR